MRQLKRFVLLFGPMLMVAAALSLLSTPALQAQQGGTADLSKCLTGLQKSVSPDTVNPGDTARVTMIMTHTCPMEHKPVDLVFLVDVSNSMTRGKGNTRTAPTDPNEPTPSRSTVPLPTRPPRPGDPNPLVALLSSNDLIINPDQNEPDPGGPVVVPPGGGATNPEPGLRPGSEPSGCGGNDAVNPGGGPGTIIGGTATPPGPAPPAPGGPGNPDPGGPGVVPPGGGVAVPGPGAADPFDEQPGSEDLIRESQRWLRKFATEPMIQDEMKKGKLRIGMVAFNDRGRRILSLSDDNRRLVSRLSILRGSGKTRIDIAMRSAESAFRQFNRGFKFRKESDRSQVIIVISDGQFCSKDLSKATRAVDKKIRVLALAAGRGANQRKLRDLVTDKKYVLILRDLDIDELLKIYSDSSLPNAISVFDPVDITKLTVRETLTDTIDLVPGSLNPAPATINGRTIEWVFPQPSSAITIEFDIQPNTEGVHPVSDSSRAEWQDTQGRSGSADFPDVQIERKQP